MAKILLLQPPQWYPISPHLAVPLLAGQLKHAGFTVKAVDLNVQFYNYLLTKERTAYCDKTARNFLKDNSALDDIDVIELQKNGGYFEKINYLKYRVIKQFYSDYGAEIENVINSIDDSVAVLRDKERFYVPEELFEAKHIIKLALRLVSMPYAPNEIDVDNYFANPSLNLDWNSIKLQAEDKSVNMFYEYFDNFSSEISSENYDVITISMTDLSQLIPVFTLAKMLKAKTNSKIVIGGNYLTQIYDEMIKYPEMFLSYFDFLLIGDGEIALTNLCRYLDGKCVFSDIPNIVYLNQENDVTFTGITTDKIDLNSLSYADFTDYDFSLYFSPELVIPIQLSKGCYWGKCSFCDYPFGQQGYCPKSIEHIIGEIKYFVDKYNVSKFMFVDEAIPPKFYCDLAEAIINENLKINFYSFARLETGFSYEVLSKLYHAGARLFLWGYESSSKRIMNMMNKGINIDNRLRILSDSRKAGIWNNGLFMFGYPTETIEETQETIRFIKENRYIVPSCTLSNFSLKKNSRLVKSVGENGVKSYASGGEFYTVYKDVIDGISQSERRRIRRDFQFEFLEENQNSLWPVVFSDFDHLLLYLSKFGCDYVSSYRSSKRICPEFR